MSLTILVTGLLPYDSGKTFVGRSLLKYFRSLGYRAVGYKPIAAHSAWFQYETVEKSFEQRILVGHDAYLYWKDMGGEVRVEEINPVDILTAPIDFNQNVRLYLSMLESFVSQACMMRISCPKNNGSHMVTEHYVDSEQLEKTIPTLQLKLIELAEKLTPQPKLITHEQMEKLMNDTKPIVCADTQLRILTTKYNVVIIESFNNAASPTPLSAEIADKVLVVMPGKALIYDGKKYMQTLKILEQTIRGKIAYTTVTQQIVELIKPLGYVKVNPNLEPSEKALENLGSLILQNFEEYSVKVSNKN